MTETDIDTQSAPAEHLAEQETEAKLPWESIDPDEAPAPFVSPFASTAIKVVEAGKGGSGKKARKRASEKNAGKGASGNQSPLASPILLDRFATLESEAAASIPEDEREEQLADRAFFSDRKISIEMLAEDAAPAKESESTEQILATAREVLNAHDVLLEHAADVVAETKEDVWSQERVGEVHNVPVIAETVSAVADSAEINGHARNGNRFDENHDVPVIAEAASAKADPTEIKVEISSDGRIAEDNDVPVMADFAPDDDDEARPALLDDATTFSGAACGPSVSSAHDMGSTVNNVPQAGSLNVAMQETGLLPGRSCEAESAGIGSRNDEIELGSRISGADEIANQVHLLDVEPDDKPLPALARIDDVIVMTAPVETVDVLEQAGTTISDARDEAISDHVYEMDEELPVTSAEREGVIGALELEIADAPVVSVTAPADAVLETSITVTTSDSLQNAAAELVTLTNSFLAEEIDEPRDLGVVVSVTTSDEVTGLADSAPELAVQSQTEIEAETETEVDLEPELAAPAVGTGGGWTIPLMCLGIGLIACCMVIPQGEANRKLRYEQAALVADLKQVQKQGEVNDEFLKKVADDPTLAERLAGRQMKTIRKGQKPIDLKQSADESDMSPFSLVAVAKPADLPPYKPKTGTIANLCNNARSRLYLLGVSLAMVAVGLVMGFGGVPDSRKPETRNGDTEPVAGLGEELD